MHNAGETADRTDEGGESQIRDSSDQPLIIERLADHHRIAEFCCKKKAKSERVERFLREQAGKFKASRFASIFIVSPRSDPASVFGFYTLSAASLKYDDMPLSRSQQRKVPGHIDFPMAKLGFMGKADDCPVGRLGEILIADAANRLSQEIAVGIWGIILDAELGDPHSSNFNPEPEKDKLVLMYRDLGFQSLSKQPVPHTHAMFAKLDWLMGDQPKN